jgi:uncharacterized membrane protein
MFNSGFIFEIVHDPIVESLPLSVGAIENDTRNIRIDKKIGLRYIFPSEQEISSAEWLASCRESKAPIYATFFDSRVPSLIAYGLVPAGETNPILPPESTIDITGGYIYLGYVNTVYGYGVTNSVFLKEHIYYESAIWDISELKPALVYSYRVYDNGASTIYWSP